MNLRSLPLVLLFGCGAFKAKLHTANTELPVSASAQLGTRCDAFPFDHTYSFDELTGDAAKELGEGRKVCEFKMTMSVAQAPETTVTASTGCDAPQGSVVMERVVLEYNNEEGVSTKAEKECNSRLTLNSAQAQNDALNSASLCLSAAISENIEDVKKAFTGKTKKLRVRVDSTCADDACFASEWVVKTTVSDGIIVLGDCPKQ